MKLLTAKRQGGRRGQTLVEAALVMGGILIPITVGIVQFGIVLNATNTLTQLAREGARYAAVHGTEANSDTAIKNYIRQVAAGTSIATADLPDSKIAISMIGGSARASGNAIHVVITYPMAKKVFVGSMVFDAVKLKQDYIAESTFVLE